MRTLIVLPLAYQNQRQSAPLQPWTGELRNLRKWKKQIHWIHWIHEATISSLGLTFKLKLLGFPRAPPLYLPCRQCILLQRQIRVERAKCPGCRSSQATSLQFQQLTRSLMTHMTHASNRYDSLEHVGSNEVILTNLLIVSNSHPPEIPQHNCPWSWMQPGQVQRHLCSTGLAPHQVAAFWLMLIKFLNKPPIRQANHFPSSIKP